MLEYSSIEELVKAAEDRGCKISELVLSDEAKQMEESEETVYKRMADSFKVMREAVRKVHLWTYRGRRLQNEVLQGKNRRRPHGRFYDRSHIKGHSCI